ncbi:MAG TPA: YhbY family RNA-binding protein [Burkholderiales bacterium]|nr:YhbY family RNA-binding protein [Burkholderiales bacterium]
MADITPAARRALRARAHRLHPVVIIGEAGLTPAVLKEIDAALRSHALIKIRVLGEDRALRRAWMTEICQKLDAAAVQEIGKLLVVHRPRPPQTAVQSVPRRHGRKEKRPRRTKRSYQMQ